MSPAHAGAARRRRVQRAARRHHRASDAVQVAERLRQALEAPFDLDGHQVFVSARSALPSAPAATPAPTTSCATPRSRSTAPPPRPRPYEIFDPAMRQRAMTRLQVETDLRNAIDNQDFELHYQPIISLQHRPHRRVRGAGALASPGARAGAAGRLHRDRRRHRHDRRHRAADAGRIVPADGGVDGATSAPPRRDVMCANVSSKQFADTELMNEIAATLQATGLLPGSLKLEITESAFIHDVPAAQIAERARSMGIGVEPRRLRHRLFVAELPASPAGRHRQGGPIVRQRDRRRRSGSAMVRAIVGLAHTLGMDVVAEGVETAEQAAELREFGCEYAQGFYFSGASTIRPRPPDRVAALAARTASAYGAVTASVSKRPTFLPALRPCR